VRSGQPDTSRWLPRSAPSLHPLAHAPAVASNVQSAAWPIDPDVDAAAGGDLSDSGGPVIALQWSKDDLEQLSLVRLDISPSAAMATVGIEAEPDEATAAAAWRLLEAGDTLGISQVESVGFRMLLKRAHDLAELQSEHGQALRSVEDLAQLLSLWKPGVYSKEREEAYFDVRFAARERPSYRHPAMAAVLGKSAGQVLFADQLVEHVNRQRWPAAASQRSGFSAWRGRQPGPARASRSAKSSSNSATPVSTRPPSTRSWRRAIAWRSTPASEW
jgi:Bacterial DNA polymerase III alpha subunit finger domain